MVDIRDEKNVNDAVAAGVKEFGGNYTQSSFFNLFLKVVLGKK